MTEHVALDLALLVSLGALAQWFAWRTNIPAILPLLLTGFIIGPVTGFFKPTELFDEHLLFPTISLAVGLILFEGGLTLKIPEMREIRNVVFNLVTIGALITWLGTTAAAYYLTELGLSLSFVFGSLVVVTGPTVIGPLLRNVRPTARVANILRWEGILIDPVGGLLALLVFEFVSQSKNESWQDIARLFLSFMGVGTVVGIIAGIFLTFLLRRRLLPDYLMNVSALALMFFTFAIANAIVDESGLLATTVMGLVMANLHPPGIESILDFKEDLSLLFISILFLELAANINLEAFLDVINLNSLLMLVVLIVVIRPLGILASTISSPLKWQEKIFIASTAPRGIVAAAVSSIFASRLSEYGMLGANALVPLVFLVIVTTVLLSSLTAKPLARWLKIAEPDPQGFLILGANPIAISIAKALKKENIPVLVTSNEWDEVKTARLRGLNTYYGSPLSDRSDDEINLAGIGNLLALTKKDEVNSLAAIKYGRLFGSAHVYQLASPKDSRNKVSKEQRGRSIFYGGMTYDQLSEMSDENSYLDIKHSNITESFGIHQALSTYKDYIPLFIINNGKVRVVTRPNIEPEAGSKVLAVTKGEKVENPVQLEPSPKTPPEKSKD